MITLRKSHERGHANHGWLDTYHTFSFSTYQDPRHTRFRTLRVMNEDWVAPGQGFGRHPHQDMEIVTYVLEGELKHEDSMGNGSVLRAGDFQRMSAGTGIEHSEFNPSSSEPVHLYQIWLFPDERGHTPSYEDRTFDPAEKQDRLRLVASPDGRDDSLTIHQDADIYLANLSAGKEVSHELRPGRHAWLQVLRGSVRVGTDDASATELGAGDAAALSEEAAVRVAAVNPAEVMLFDLN
jgi:redox-sensitive bicupin YhaK (pirin superfamily)